MPERARDERSHALRAAGLLARLRQALVNIVAEPNVGAAVPAVEEDLVALGRLDADDLNVAHAVPARAASLRVVTVETDASQNARAVTERPDSVVLGARAEAAELHEREARLVRPRPPRRAVDASVVAARAQNRIESEEEESETEMQVSCAATTMRSAAAQGRAVWSKLGHVIQLVVDHVIVRLVLKRGANEHRGEEEAVAQVRKRRRQLCQARRELAGVERLPSA